MRSELEILMDVSPLWTVDLKSFESGTPLDMPGEVCTLIPLNLFDFDALFLFRSPCSPSPRSINFLADWLLLFLLPFSLGSTRLRYLGLSRERLEMWTHTRAHACAVQAMCRLHQFSWGMYGLSWVSQGRVHFPQLFNWLCLFHSLLNSIYSMVHGFYSVLNTTYAPLSNFTVQTEHSQEQTSTVSF